jgi:hypothetical protein
MLDGCSGTLAGGSLDGGALAAALTGSASAGSVSSESALRMNCCSRESTRPRPVPSGEKSSMPQTNWREPALKTSLPEGAV